MLDKTKTEKRKRSSEVKWFVFNYIQISEDCKIKNKLILIEWNRVEFMCCGALLSVVVLLLLYCVVYFEWICLNGWRMFLNKKNKRNVFIQSYVSKLQSNPIQFNQIKFSPIRWDAILFTSF